MRVCVCVCVQMGQCSLQATAVEELFVVPSDCRIRVRMSQLPTRNGHIFPKPGPPSDRRGRPECHRLHCRR